MSQHLSGEGAQHNHVKKLLGMIAAGQIPEARGVVIGILHHEECGLVTRGSRCDCDPKIGVLSDGDRNGPADAATQSRRTG